MPSRRSTWGGRKAQAWTRQVLETYGLRCWLQLEGCTQLATTGDHVIPRERAPWLQYVVANGRPACLHCNSARGDRDAPKALTSVDATEFFDTLTPGRRSEER